MKPLNEVGMTNRLLKNCLALFLAGCFLGGTFFVALSVLEPVGLLSARAAAWVQALGSIGAIFVTGGLFLEQRRAEARNQDDLRLQSRLRDAQRSQAIAYWAVESVRAAAASTEAGGASQGMPFRAGRFKELRKMMNALAASATDNAVVLMALAFSHQLNQAHSEYVGLPQIHFDIRPDALIRRANEMQGMYDRVLAYQQKLEAQCQLRRITTGESEVE